MPQPGRSLGVIAGRAQEIGVRVRSGGKYKVYRNSCISSKLKYILLCAILIFWQLYIDMVFCKSECNKPVKCLYRKVGGGGSGVISCVTNQDMKWCNIFAQISSKSGVFDLVGFIPDELCYASNICVNFTV